jgi:hypothetical protein
MEMTQLIAREEWADRGIWCFLKSNPTVAVWSTPLVVSGKVSEMGSQCPNQCWVPGSYLGEVLFQELNPEERTTQSVVTQAS